MSPSFLEERARLDLVEPLARINDENRPPSRKGTDRELQQRKEVKRNEGMH